VTFLLVFVPLAHSLSGMQVDALALVQAIERYLMERGYSKTRPEGEADQPGIISDDGDSEDELDDSLVRRVSCDHLNV